MPAQGSQLTPEEINALATEAFPAQRHRCVEVGDRWAVARHEVDAEALRPGEMVSGPTIFAMADVVLWYALFGAVGYEPMAVTSELSIRFLRPARGPVLMGRADLDHVGRRSVIGTVRCWMEGDETRPVAVAQGAYVRPRSQEPVAQ